MLTGAFANLVLNTLIAVLLCVTIAYCWVLNRRIKILQDSRGELALLLKHFDESTKRASDSIIGLQTASKKIGENVQIRIEKANYALDDLAYMIEKGEQVANKLEASFAVNRARNRVMAEQPAPAPVAEKPAPVAEKAAKPIRIEYPKEEPESAESLMQAAEKALSSRDKTAASLEAVLERVVGRSKLQDNEAANGGGASSGWPPQAKVERAAPSRSRSRAEQELLDMIKTGIKG